MDVSAVFTPVAVELIQNVFPTDVVYHQHGASTYDALTGAMTSGDTDHAIKAGVLSRKRLEEGGANETYEIALWVHHGTGGLGFLPTTADSFTYDGVVWKVTTVDPTYSSKSLIASKITGRG